MTEQTLKPERIITTTCPVFGPARPLLGFSNALFLLFQIFGNLVGEEGLLKFLGNVDLRVNSHKILPETEAQFRC